jgi:hypothetical protein
MSFDETGGPAFPCERQLTDQDVLVFEGITIRDYFAAKAMQALLNSDEWREHLDEHAEVPSEFTAASAYVMADAMLEARK